MVIRLDRLSTSDQGTFGQIILPDQVVFTGELPWRDNTPGKSCIPEGEYRCVWGPSPRFGHAFEVTGVPGRSRVLIHNGNYCGDVDKGFRSHVLGCVLLGQARGKLGGQQAVLLSRYAMTGFQKAVGVEPFTLEVRNNGLF